MKTDSQNIWVNIDPGTSTIKVSATHNPSDPSTYYRFSFLNMGLRCGQDAMLGSEESCILSPFQGIVGEHVAPLDPENQIVLDNDWTDERLMLQLFWAINHACDTFSLGNAVNVHLAIALPAANISAGKQLKKYLETHVWPGKNASDKSVLRELTIDVTVREQSAYVLTSQIYAIHGKGNHVVLSDERGRQLLKNAPVMVLQFGSKTIEIAIMTTPTDVKMESIFLGTFNLVERLKTEAYRLTGKNFTRVDLIKWTIDGTLSYTSYEDGRVTVDASTEVTDILCGLLQERAFTQGMRRLINKYQPKTCLLSGGTALRVGETFQSMYSHLFENCEPVTDDKGNHDVLLSLLSGMEKDMLKKAGRVAE